MTARAGMAGTGGGKDTPGPGNYKITPTINCKNPNLGNSPNYSIVPKRPDLGAKAMKTPGPSLNYTTFGV